MASIGYLQITRICNQCCRFCSNPENQNTITLEQGRGFIDALVRDGGYDSVLFTGGEPTMSPDLPAYIEYAGEKGIPSIVITNGQKLADRAYVDQLKAAGLSHICMSLYSHDPEIQAFLTANAHSLENFTSAAANIAAANEIGLDVVITINKYNAYHLSEIVRFVHEQAAPICKHVVFNFMDPLMNRAAENTDTIPMLNDADLELDRAVALLRGWGMTFRIERVPLCYMGGFEHVSTETRRIVKKEKCRILFLDERGEVDKREGDVFYGKAECCEICYLKDICAGLYSMDIHYSSRELFPVFHITADEVIEKINNNES